MDTTLKFSQLEWSDSTRGMKDARVHVRIFDTTRQRWEVRTHVPVTIGETTHAAHPFETAAQARAYGMRWKARRGDILVEYAKAI
jgi:hypothetical protein